MKSLWLALLLLSSGSLMFLLIRRQLPKGWFVRFGTHLVLAALAIYAINFSGLAAGWYMPINPATVGAVALLGIPGIGLVYGMQQLVLS
ncbi:pro-sigmaK processing inhibitor BofA family protein [Cohnella sp. AR92]|uniref:pro-sigmaK processing inhibitor BofA family protein n=1 Tax=Cohnella sp. AR92 TaxID=648716 RepID=UPI000F8D4D5C|nr:pro-sigmaK processing inhibitor BofA family protein [Cohnella sp. AR92]RUS44218.1 pro-sigmaK processing inhibitor BofA [Cohnella sp. AR92]